MYTHIWLKYLPVIRILMKRSASGEQVFDLNRTDFEKAGTGRKAGYKFTIELGGGRVTNVISHAPLALDLANTLLQDEVIKGLLANADYKVSLNTKFQVTIENTTLAPTPQKKTGKKEQVTEE